MQTIEITCHIYAARNAWDNETRYEVATFGPEFAGPTWLHVCEHKVVVEMPSTFNPVAAELEAIEREIEKVTAESGALIKRLNDRKANLTCIEYTPAKEASECPDCHGKGSVDVTHEPLRDGYTETFGECCDTCQGEGTVSPAIGEAA